MTNIALILVNNTQLGGAERRFARAYTGLRRRNVRVALVINESLLAKLVGSGVLEPDNQPALVLREPFGAAVRALLRGWPQTGGARASLAFWLSKLDYVLGCITITGWLLLHRPRVMHLVLGGVYLAFPRQLMAGAPASVVSVVCPSIQQMVGAPVGERLYRTALQRAAAVDALTEPIRNEVVRLGVRDERVHVSPGSFVDSDRFAPSDMRCRWIVFTGRLVEEKSPMLFVEACAEVHRRTRDRMSDVRYIVSGDGPLRQDMEIAAERHGLSAVMTIGWRERVEDILPHALVFVSLQRMDNYPSQALLEAMACGCAVVATEVGQTWKLVDEHTGFRVAMKASAVADAVVWLLDNPEQAVKYGANGRDRVLKEQSLDTYLNYLQQVYDDASRV